MEAASHRACAHCRAQKVRCLPTPDNPKICQRCQKAGRQCVFTPLQKRKQRKRTDTRVAELEREMRAMRTMLKTNESPKKTSIDATGTPVGNTRPEGLWTDEINAAGTALTAMVSEKEATRSPVTAFTSPPGMPRTESQSSQVFTEDIVTRGIVTEEVAHNLVEVYKSRLHINAPILYIPESWTAATMRRHKPTLFLAICAAAACSSRPSISMALDAELLRIYAEKILMNSEKSLELLQCLLVSAAWYSPPKKFGQLKYYEYISMATTMAIEIGVAVRPTQRRPRLRNHLDKTLGRPESGATTEEKRTFCSLFNLIQGVSFGLRRPLLMRPTKYLEECMESIATCPDQVYSDGSMLAWTSLALLSSEMAEAFSFDDPEHFVSIADARTQTMLRDYTRRFDQWEASISESDFYPALKIMYYYARMSMLEVALHIDHAPEDFRAPYQMGRLQVYKGADLPTKVLVNCIADLISTAHAMLDTYLSMDLDHARTMPVLTSVRASFAAFIIAKLCQSYASKESRLASLMDRGSLKAEYYMDKMILHVREIIGPQGYRIPAIFLALLFRVRQWCANPESIHSAGESDIAALRTGLDEISTDELRSRAYQTPSGSEATGSAQQSPGMQTSPAMRNMASTHPYDPSNTYVFSEQMELDENFFDFLNDVNYFQGGGLTGLDDWAAQPSEMMSMSSNVNMRWPPNVNAAPNT